MGAPRRISDRVLVAAFVRWKGNVEGAADSIPIAPNNMRKRLQALGMDLASARAEIRTGTFGISRYVPDESPPTEPPVRLSGTAQRSAPAIYPKPVETPTLGSVSSAVPEFARRGDKPIRVLPEHGDRIRRGRRQLSAQADADLDDSALLAQFIEERWDDWLSEQTKTARRERTEGEDGGGGEG